MNNKELDELVDLCNFLGRDIYQIQAAGGNVSVKLNATQMLIKASGAKMKEVRANQGWLGIRYAHLPATFQSIFDREPSALKREIFYAKAIGGAAENSDKKPSMESGFHSVIQNKYTAHVHSIAGIILGMFPQPSAMETLQKIFTDLPDIYFVPASLPGFEVSYSIQKLKIQSSGKIHLFILKNHGLIWSGNNFDLLKKTIADFENYFDLKFQTKKYGFFHALGTSGCADKKIPQTKEN